MQTCRSCSLKRKRCEHAIHPRTSRHVPEVAAEVDAEGAEVDAHAGEVYVARRSEREERSERSGASWNGERGKGGAQCTSQGRV